MRKVSLDSDNKTFVRICMIAKKNPIWYCDPSKAGLNIPRESILTSTDIIHSIGWIILVDCKDYCITERANPIFCAVGLR